MKSYLLAFILILAFLPLVASAPPVKTITSTGGLTVSPNLVNYIPLNVSREWEIHATNSTNVIHSGLTCTIHIYEEYKDGGHIYTNSSSTFSNVYDIEMVSDPSVHNTKGQYSIKAFCNTSSEAGFYEGTYYVTSTGNPPADDIFIAVIWILFIFSVVLLFYTFFMTIFKLVTADETVYDVLLAWSSYILVIIVNYLGSDYLIRTYIEDITGQLLTLTVWTNGVLPLIAFIITFFIKSTMKRRPLTPVEAGGFKYG